MVARLRPTTPTDTFTAMVPSVRIAIHASNELRCSRSTQDGAASEIHAGSGTLPKTLSIASLMPNGGTSASAVVSASVPNATASGARYGPSRPRYARKSAPNERVRWPFGLTGLPRASSDFDFARFASSAR